MNIFFNGECKNDKTDEVIFDIQVFGGEEDEFLILVYRFKPGMEDLLGIWITQILDPIGEIKKLNIVGIDCPADPDPDFRDDADCWNITIGSKRGKMMVQSVEKAN